MDKYSAAIVTLSLIAGAASAQPTPAAGYHNGTGSPATHIESVAPVLPSRSAQVSPPRSKH